MYDPARNEFLLCLLFFLQDTGRSHCNTDSKGERHRSPKKRHHNEARCFECKKRQLSRDQTENIPHYTLKGGGKKTN